MMEHFEVIPTRAGWRLVEWRIMPPWLMPRACFIKFMPWKPLRSMTPSRGVA